jgi:hypothetical protein
MEANQDSVDRVYHVVRLMRGRTPALGVEDSADFTAGYLPALDDLLAWLRDELHRYPPRRCAA